MQYIVLSISRRLFNDQRMSRLKIALVFILQVAF